MFGYLTPKLETGAASLCGLSREKFLTFGLEKDEYQLS
jgi:hypothetical protein